MSDFENPGDVEKWLDSISNDHPSRGLVGILLLLVLGFGSVFYVYRLGGIQEQEHDDEARREYLERVRAQAEAEAAEARRVMEAELELREIEAQQAQMTIRTGYSDYLPQALMSRITDKEIPYTITNTYLEFVPDAALPISRYQSYEPIRCDMGDLRVVGSDVRETFGSIMAKQGGRSRVTRARRYSDGRS